jgi:hypothetical protein
MILEMNEFGYVVEILMQILQVKFGTVWDEV